MSFTEFFNNESHSNGKCPEDIEESIDDRLNDTQLKIKSKENKILTVADKETDIILDQPIVSADSGYL